MSQSTTHPIAVMDGTCALCTLGARVIDMLDRTGEIRIAPIQSDTGQRLMRDNGLDPLEPDTWLLIEPNGTVYRDLEALIHLGHRTGGWGRLLLGLHVIPKRLRTLLYARIAQNRYRLFGKADICKHQSSSLRARLLS